MQFRAMELVQFAMKRKREGNMNNFGALGVWRSQ
jgi:hypothetical protein